MKTILTAIAALALGGQALALPMPPKVQPEVTYDRMMVLVPGLEGLGYSRLVSVEYCAEVTKVKDWTALTTDSELEGMEACLVDLT